MSFVTNRAFRKHLKNGAILAAFLFLPISAGLAQVVVGPNVNVTRRADNQSEETIAVDPTNPLRLFVGANSPGDGFVGSFSTDGGLNWVTQNLGGGGPDGLKTSCCDPSAVFDSFGNLWFTYLAGDGNSIRLALSTNGGQTWTNLPNLGAGHVDQPTVVTGPGTTPGSVTVWVAFHDDSAKVAIRGATVTGLGTFGAFSPAEEAPGSAGGDYSDLAIGPAGQVIVAWQKPGDGQGPGALDTALDPDGAGPASFHAGVAFSSTNVGGLDYITPQSSRTIDAEVALAWDRTGGLYNNRIYLVYTDELPNEGNNTETFLRHSDDAGSTWSNPVRVNDDPGLASQFLPRIVVDQTSGTIAVTWHDCRNDAGTGGPGDTNSKANDDAEFYGAISTDGGLSFLPNFQISDGASNAVAAHARWDYGDYSGLDFYGGAIYPAWADNSNSTGDNPDGTLSTFDVYTSHITVTSGGSVLSLAPAALDPGVLDFAYAQTIRPTGGTPPYSFQQTGTLPAGLTLNCSTLLCTLSGVPTAQGQFSFGVNITDAHGYSGSRAYTVDIAATCLFCDDFEDGTLSLSWEYLKATWTESGGTLNVAPTKKATALADPVFAAGCSVCTIESTLMTAGKEIWLYGWYHDKKNTVEVLATTGYWTLRQRVAGKISAQSKVIAPVQSNVTYDVRLTNDGKNVFLWIDGSLLSAIPITGPILGTVGFLVKAAPGQFGFIKVN